MVICNWLPQGKNNAVPIVALLQLHSNVIVCFGGLKQRFAVGAIKPATLTDAWPGCGRIILFYGTINNISGPAGRTSLAPWTMGVGRGRATDTIKIRSDIIENGPWMAVFILTDLFWSGRRPFVKGIVKQ